MPKQLQTALEARRWMVANPKHTVTDKYGKLHYWWDDFECKFFSEAEVVIISDIFAPFTIIDEPTVRESRTTQTDPQTGELYSADWVGGKQPEWVRVYVADENPVRPKVGEPFVGEMEYVWANKPEKCLKHICQHAQQVRITWPEWEYDRAKEMESALDLFNRKSRMKLLYALQIGAVVEYLPKEGK